MLMEQKAFPYHGTGNMSVLCVRSEFLAALHTKSTVTARNVVEISLRFEGTECLPKHLLL